MLSVIWRNRIPCSLSYLSNLSRRVATMADSFESGESSRKRQRLENEDYRPGRRDLHSSLTGSISPPPLRRPRTAQAQKLMPSPFQLTSIRDLPASSNLDAVSLKDILGDPLIAECWEFNYLHNLDFLMDAFDEDVRDLVKVHVIHGFWKNEDTSRLSLKVKPRFPPGLSLNYLATENAMASNLRLIKSVGAS